MQQPDAAALMASIRANKADDLPRLIYADWLEEQGQEERAAFIRQGVSGGVIAPIIAGDDNGWQYRMSGTRVEDWRRGLVTKQQLDGEGNRARSRTYEFAIGEFWRGFIHSIQGTHDWFVANAAAIFRENPVERVTLTDRPGILAFDIIGDGDFVEQLPGSVRVSLVEFGEAMAEGRSPFSPAPSDVHFDTPLSR
jgi:uncharacterized protein (TIGR02996 family)